MGATSTSLNQSRNLTTPGSYIYEARARRTSGGAGEIWFGVTKIQYSGATPYRGDSAYFKIDPSGVSDYGVTVNNDVSTSVAQTLFPLNAYQDVRIVAVSATQTYMYPGYSAVTSHTLDLSNEAMGLFFNVNAVPGTTGDQIYSFIRYYADDQPNFTAAGSAETIPEFISINASSTQQLYDNTFVVWASTTAINASVITVPFNYIGSLNIKYNLRGDSFCGTTGYGQIYKNGHPWGTKFSVLGAPLQQQSEDFNFFTQGITAGDTIELWISSSVGGCQVAINNLSINFDYDPTPFTLLTPLNGSTVNNPVTLTWRQWTTTNPHTYQVSTDSTFVNIIESGIATSTTPFYDKTLTDLAEGTYYWHVKNSTSSYTPYFSFTIAAPTPIPGQFNITAFDEQLWTTRIMSFNAQLYNSTTTFNKSTTNGWVNFSSSEVVAGEYLIRIIPNSSYASRSVLANSPGNVTVHLPSTSNTIDTIAFYLLDYTNKYPWDTSYLSVTKNNSVMHSAYFDADAKVAVYLIRGDSYGVSVTNGNNMQNWGNYISTASGNVEVVIMDIGVNSTLRNPFVYNVTWNNSDMILQWTDSYNVMTSINYSVFKGTDKTLVHQLITSLDHGSSDYIVTNTSDIYYVSVSALTTNGYRNQSYVIDYRAGTSATQGESSDLYSWSYGSATIPAWVKNAFAVIALMILAGSFGAMHRGEGAIITGIMALIFWKWSWLSATGAGAGFLGALLLFAVLYHLDTKRKGGGYF